MSANVMHLDNDGGTQLTGYTWADAFAGVTQTARKFGVMNTGSRVLADLIESIQQVGTNDGNSQLRIGADTATVSAPYGVTATLVTATWVGSTGNVYYRITATNGTGETIGSIEVSVNLPDTTKQIQLDWTLPTGATGIKIYRSYVSGTYTTPALRATVGAVSTYTDDGDTLSSGSLPSINTTGGAGPTYGTAPALATTPLTIGDLAVGQQYFYWVNRVVPGNTDEAGNPRQADIQFAES